MKMIIELYGKWWSRWAIAEIDYHSDIIFKSLPLSSVHVHGHVATVPSISLDEYINRLRSCHSQFHASWLSSLNEHASQLFHQHFNRHIIASKSISSSSSPSSSSPASPSSITRHTSSLELVIKETKERPHQKDSIGSPQRRSTTSNTASSHGHANGVAVTKQLGQPNTSSLPGTLTSSLTPITTDSKMQQLGQLVESTTKLIPKKSSIPLLIQDKPCRCGSPVVIGRWADSDGHQSMTDQYRCTRTKGHPRKCSSINTHPHVSTSSLVSFSSSLVHPHHAQVAHVPFTQTVHQVATSSVHPDFHITHSHQTHIHLVHHPNGNHPPPAYVVSTKNLMPLKPPQYHGLTQLLQSMMQQPQGIDRSLSLNSSSQNYPINYAPNQPIIRLLSPSLVPQFYPRTSHPQPPINMTRPSITVPVSIQPGAGSSPQIHQQTCYHCFGPLTYLNQTMRCQPYHCHVCPGSR
jgi:hypothetical protein